MMRILLIALFGLAPALAPEARAQNFEATFARLGNTRWTGTFEAKGTLGYDEFLASDCSGPIQVKFYNDEGKVFPDEDPTISYRHHADFSGDANPLCRFVGPSLSAVDVGSCPTFPKRFDLDENQWVPFRTLVASHGGNSAVVSSPSCEKGAVVRQAIELAVLDLQDQNPSQPKSLRVTIRLSTKIGELIPLKAELTYLLAPAPQPAFSGAWTDMIRLHYPRLD